MDQNSDLLRFAENLRIAHHIPGRIRLKLVVDLADADVDILGGAKRFHAALSGRAGIRSISLNPLARSCTVEYDTAVIPTSAWQDLLAGTHSAAADILLDTFGAARRTATNS